MDSHPFLTKTQEGYSFLVKITKFGDFLARANPWTRDKAGPSLLAASWLRDRKSWLLEKPRFSAWQRWGCLSAPAGADGRLRLVQRLKIDEVGESPSATFSYYRHRLATGVVGDWSSTLRCRQPQNRHQVGKFSKFARERYPTIPIPLKIRLHAEERPLVFKVRHRSEISLINKRLFLYWEKEKRSFKFILNFKLNLNFKL